MWNYLKILVIGLVVAGLVALFLTSDLALFNPKGVVALAERHLIIVSALLVLIVVVPVYVLVLGIIWRYRAGNTTAKYTPDWANNVALETIWWTVPCIIILVLGVITWESTHTLDPYKPIVSEEKPLTIEVVALDWKWLFIYPEENIATINFIQFPVNRPIRFVITADAPMNSFWIPQLGGQIYAMSGMATTLNLMATEAGEYKGLSSNFSGSGFSEMKFIAKADTKDAFDAWVEAVRQSPLALNQAQYSLLVKPAVSSINTLYSSVEGDIFHQILMKYMAPMPDEMEGMDMSQMNMNNSH